MGEQTLTGVPVKKGERRSVGGHLFAPMAPRGAGYGTDEPGRLSCHVSQNRGPPTMHEKYINLSRCSLYAWMASLLAMAALVGVWCCAARRVPVHLMIALALSTVFVVGVAAVLHVRCYLIRLSSVIRATAGLETPGEGSRLRALH